MRKQIHLTAVLSSAALTLGAWSASAAITDNLVGHWTLNESDPESLVVVNSAPVGGAESGVRTSTMLLDQLAPVGTGYFFDGSANDFVNVGTTVINQLKQVRELSISGWIKPEFLRPQSGAAGRQTIMGADTGMQFALHEQGSIL